LALDGPRFDAGSAPLAPEGQPGATLWSDAGLIRSAEGLGRLLDSPHPLVREIAACGLAREESRGVHFREDFPVERGELAGHLVVHPGRGPLLERWS
jgi:succinate dehydrogenase/fumarate reductase flavoprotein subunit